MALPARPGGKKYNVGPGKTTKPKPKPVAGNGVSGVTSPVPSLKLPGSTDVKVGGVHVGTVNVAALRNYLRAKGYDLPKTNSGTAGRRLLSALNDFGPQNLPAKQFGGSPAIAALLHTKGWHPDAETGRQKPNMWNPSVGANSKVKAPTNSVVTRGGNFTPQVRAAGVGTFDPSGLNADVNALSSAVPLDEGLAKSGASLIKDPSKYADALAGMQFDAQLSDLAHQRDVNVEQTNQNVNDVGSWYNQALASLKTAGVRDAAITKAGKDSVKASDTAILASLGGDASGAASTVANAAQQNEGTLAALGATQDQYNADIQPIITQERAGQLSAERARGSQRALDLATAIAQAKNSRGQSVASNLLDLNKYNNDIRDNQLQRLLQIKQANQQQQQQNFQNDLAVQQAKLAALATGAKLAAARRTSAKPAKGSFADTPASVKAQIAGTIFNDLHAAAPKTPQAAQAIVAARLRGAGWNLANPAVGGYMQSILGNWSQSQQ